MMYSITEFALSLKMFFAEQKAISHNVKYEPEKDRENGVDLVKSAAANTAMTNSAVWNASKLRNSGLPRSA